MTVKGIVFDINGTLSDIRTDEWHADVYRVISNLLSYQGIVLDPAVVKDSYFQGMQRQLATSVERYPEFDATEIFHAIITQHASDFTRTLPPAKLAQLPGFLAETYRAAARFRLQLYPGVEETLQQLHRKYHLAVISDGQTAYAVPELNAIGLSAYFNPILVSGDFGYRKPDERPFAVALAGMQMAASEVVFVGNDMYRDVFGPQQLGMKTVFFQSNQGTYADGVQPDYVIYNFPELLDAVRFFEGR